MKLILKLIDKNRACTLRDLKATVLLSSRLVKASKKTYVLHLHLELPVQTSGDGTLYSQFSKISSFKYGRSVGFTTGENNPLKSFSAVISACFLAGSTTWIWCQQSFLEKWKLTEMFLFPTASHFGWTSSECLRRLRTHFLGTPELIMSKSMSVFKANALPFRKTLTSKGRL